jgi:hypothetical protein
MPSTQLFPICSERHPRVLSIISLTLLSLTLLMCKGNDQETASPSVSRQLAQQVYLKASNTDAGDWFGSAVALSGGTLVVGVRNEDSGATGINGNQTDNSAPDSGAAFVFTRSGGGWVQQAYLKGSNTRAGDRFGYWVDLEGDTLAVGSPMEDGSGAVYVFTRTGGVWSEQAFLKASNARAGDWFGSTVAVSGDTLVVGARFEDSGATGINSNQADTSAPDSGAAYVFTRTAGLWTQQAYLKGSNTRAGDQFGFSVDVFDNTVVVGARFEDSGAMGIGGNEVDASAPDSGALYVFTRTGVVWNQEAYVKASNTRAGDGFGNGVALAGDTLLVGAPFEDSGATGINGSQSDSSAPDSGAAYIFTRVNGVWSQEAYLKASNTGSNDNFGFHVAMAGDTLLVGAHQEDGADTGVGANDANDSATDSGAVYVFTQSGGTWSQPTYVKATNTGPGDWLGASLTVEGNTVAVGASKEASADTGSDDNQADDSAPESGAVYVFELL